MFRFTQIVHCCNCRMCFFRISFVHLKSFILQYVALYISVYSVMPKVCTRSTHLQISTRMDRLGFLNTQVLLQVPTLKLKTLCCAHRICIFLFVFLFFAYTWNMLMVPYVYYVYVCINVCFWNRPCFCKIRSNLRFFKVTKKLQNDLSVQVGET